MFAGYSRLIAAASLLCLLSLLSAPAKAQITVGGDAGEVSPADPATWVAGTTGKIGIDAGLIGTVTVAGGSNIVDSVIYLGYKVGSNGSATITGTGSTWTSNSTFNLGYSGVGTLGVDNGGKVSNSSPVYIGYNAGSSGSAVITGPGSTWADSSAIYVGRSGTGTLRAENGGKVSSTTSYLGYNAGSNGATTITGSGSAWTAGDLYAGYNGIGAITVADGGAVATGTGNTYLGFKTGSSGTATVTGAGSTWTNTGTMYVGYAGAGTLTVQDGGAVTSNGAYLGNNAGSSGSATVTGAGSTWTNTGALYVGNAGTGSLTVASGGTVTTGTLYASDLRGDGTINTKGLVANLNLVLDASHGIGTPQSFGTGGVLNWNPDSTTDFGVNTGTLQISQGVKLMVASGYLGFTAGSSGSATVTGAGSTWTSSQCLYVGDFGTGTLTVADGGKVGASYSSYLGYNAGSSGTVTVTGPGSTVSGNLYVGNSGTGTLTVANGGTANISSGYVGYSSGSNGMVDLTDSGSAWKSSYLYVGYYGTGTMKLENGATATSKGYSDYVGYYAGSNGTVTVAGAGSSWTGTSLLYVGYSGTGLLSVQNGGTVGGAWGTLGAQSGSTGQAIVAGVGSTWANSNNLIVGNSGHGGLAVADGGAVTCATGYVGYGTGSIGTASITGAGSTWSVNSSLYVGYYGTGSLAVDNGGKIATTWGYVGGSSDGLAKGTGSVSITGQGSTWTSTGSIDIGTSGPGSLSVTDGGSVSSPSCYLGCNTGSSGTATVTGAGSTWINTGTLYVRYNNAGPSTLTVDQGGTVTTGTLYAAGSDLKGNGTINANGVVSDVDLVFDATHATAQCSFGTGGTVNVAPNGANDLGVGYSGAGSLRIADGAQIATAKDYLAYNSGSTGTAVITGSGSSWACSSGLYVGNSGAGMLTIENGATVTSYIGGIAWNTGSSGTVTVTGPGSVWNNTCPWPAGNSLALIVGRDGNGTMTVLDGGTVNSTTAVVGSGTAIISGAGSTWNNAGELEIMGTAVIRVKDGGRVYNKGWTYIGDGVSGAMVVVSGSGSTWSDNNIYIGYYQNGTMRVDNGGTVLCPGCWFGYDGMATGTGVVSGIGSTWVVSGRVGITQGSLTIGGGGKMTAQGFTLYGGTTINMHVSGDGMIVADLISNDGKINLSADAFLAAETYSPFGNYPGTGITWTGAGSYNAYGGSWDNTGHTFTVAAAAASAAGQANAVTSRERLLITDSGTGKRVGASFGTVAAGTNFSAVPMGGADLIGLPTDQCVLGAWNFATNFTGDQALLSFDVGAGQSYDMSVWHYNGTSWAPFSAPDLTYGEDGIADFAVTSFVGGYALTAAAHAGDSNYDNAVNVVDLGVLAKYYDTAAGATWAMGDFSGDGRVDVVDLGVLAKNYDWSGSWAGAIPEPCCMALLALGGLGLLRRRCGYAR